MAISTTTVFDRASHWPARFAKGVTLYDEGEPSITMYRLDRGCVRLQVNGHGGDRQIVSFLFPGDLFGFCLDERRASAEAVTEVEVTCYSIASVLDLNGRTTEVLVELVNRANGAFGELAHHVEKITHLPAVERLLWFFNWLTHHDPAAAASGIIRLPMNHRDIADYLSLKPETLSRAFRQLEARGYIQRTGRRGLTLTRHALALRVRSPEEFHALEAQSAA